MLLELPINFINIKCTCLQNVYHCSEREDLVFEDDVTRVKKWRWWPRSLKMCTPSTPSISMMPNKNAKRTGTTVVNKRLQLTVIAVFEVMGNSISISSSEIQCPASSGYQCIQSPAVHVHFLLLQLKKISRYKVKMLFIPPPSLPVSSFTGRKCHYGNQSLWCTDQVNLSSQTAKQAKWNRRPGWSHQKPRTPFPSSSKQGRPIPDRGYQSVLKGSRKEI